MQPPVDASKIARLHLGSVKLPDGHPRAADGSCPIFCFAIQHPDGVLLVDTGPRAGHPIIDALYAPDVVPIIDALNNADIDERDVRSIVNTHLHFDHCGQNHLLPSVPIWVTAAEIEASKAELYTVPEWAEISDSRRRIAADDDEIAPGVHLLHTPGHTPGHLSISVMTEPGLEIIAGQACYTCAEFEAGQPAPSDMHDDNWLDAGAESVRRLRSLNPQRVHFSHDPSSFVAGDPSLET